MRIVLLIAVCILALLASFEASLRGFTEIFLIQATKSVSPTGQSGTTRLPKFVAFGATAAKGKHASPNCEAPCLHRKHARNECCENCF